MLFKRLHLQFTGLCALITMAILALFSYLYLSVSERTLWENYTLSFQHDFDALSGSLEQQNTLTYSFLLRMEQNSGCLIFLWDNGKPLSFNRLESHAPYMTMAEELYQDYRATAASPRHAQETDFYVISLSDELNMGIRNIYIGQMSAAEKTIALQKGQGLVLLMLSPNTAYHRRLMQQRVLFVLLSLAGCMALTVFAYLFTGRLLSPIRENHERQLAFISGASHELRTPLAVILSSAEAKPPRFEETIRTEALRMGRLVEEMLFLSRLDSLRFHSGTPRHGKPGSLYKSQLTHLLHMEELEPDTLLLDTYESLEQLALRQDKKLALQLPSESLPRMNGDRDKLRQLLEILVQNALSYTGEDGVITLSLEHNASSGQLLLKVSDNGIGIPDEQKDKIFERFYRVDSAHHSKDHFGLGLSIAREIVELHGGTIRVTDTPGGGSTFVCQFPV